ncbi:MAG: lactoylglutathione lyase [Hyphomicrobiales bacterium]|nr:VOC family protein [Hyphomicrobiales bacterium]PCJ88494.1 MAG: lactoylglutathione lyase [Hyphomicrobiales bacterium]
MGVFSSIAHVALQVRDLGASIEFYEKLGFPEFLRLNNDDGTPWIVYMKVDDNFFFELFPGDDTGTAPQGTTGVHHLSLDATDINETVAHLESVGIPLSTPLKPNGARGVDGNRGCWITDPDGNRIELMEMAPNCIQNEALQALKEGKGPTALTRPLKPAAS